MASYTMDAAVLYACLAKNSVPRQKFTRYTFCSANHKA